MSISGTFIYYRTSAKGRLGYWETCILQMMEKHVQHLLDTGVEPKDIVIEVRKREE